MKIKELLLYTHSLEKEKIFYTDVLNFDCIEKSKYFFTIQAGWTKLTFKLSPQQHTYHYCFLIPSNKLNESINWLKDRTSLIPIEENEAIQWFESWNAHSVYFYDESGNIAEFIVRHDLKNESSEEFSSKSILCVNEIGIPNSCIKTINTLLETKLDSLFWKGDLERFGTNGDQKGLFLLPNYHLKKEWFPTKLKLEPYPFSAQIENNTGNIFFLNYYQENLEIIPLKK